MIQFRAQIRERIQQATRALDEARAQGDDYLTTVHTGELESLVRLAREHGLLAPEAQAYLPPQATAG